MISAQVGGNPGGRLAQPRCLLLLHASRVTATLAYSLQYCSKYSVFSCSDSCASLFQGVNNYQLNFVKEKNKNIKRSFRAGRNWYNTYNVIWQKGKEMYVTMWHFPAEQQIFLEKKRIWDGFKLGSSSPTPDSKHWTCDSPLLWELAHKKGPI